MTIKNTRTKVSPGGVITLPVSARKALGMKPKTGSRVTVAVKGNTVLLAPATCRRRIPGLTRRPNGGRVATP